jgi:hypothetical protein
MHKPIPTTPEQVAQFGHIAANIRKLMANKGWKIADLNEALGHPRVYTGPYAWLKAKAAPGSKGRQKLAEMTGLKPEDFAKRNAAVSMARPKNEIVKYRAQSAGMSMSVSVSEPKPTEILKFTILNNGQAKIELNVSLSTTDAMPLMRLLMDTDAVRSNRHNTGNPQSGMPSLPREQHD